MLKTILLSILITTLVSSLLGLLYIPKFWIIFSLAFIAQILFFYFFNTWYENNLIEKAEKIKLEQFKEATKNIVAVQCPCDQKNKQEIEIRFDTDTIYLCNKCNKDVKAVLDVSTVLITTPIYADDRVR
jgi:hypothetical protein